MTVSTFFCYALEDTELLRKLQKFMKPMQNEGLITMWNASMIPPGETVEQAIEEELNSADLVLIPVTSNSIASNNCLKQINQAKERYQKRRAEVIPIILGPTSWKYDLGMIPPLPASERPVLSEPDPDKALDEVVKSIAFTISKSDRIHSKPLSPRAGEGNEVKHGRKRKPSRTSEAVVTGERGLKVETENSKQSFEEIVTLTTPDRSGVKTTSSAQLPEEAVTGITSAESRTETNLSTNPGEHPDV